MSQQLELGNGSMEALLGQVADEFTDRINQGERPDVEDYARRHPEMATILRQVLPALQVMGPCSPLVAPGGAQAASEVLVSRCLGDFRLLREVGRGGMGIVYEAEQLSLGRRVALKVLPFAGTMDARQLQRFQNEARAAAGLHHTNIVPVYFVGSERGVHYYAMQFIEGQDLATAVAQLRAQAGHEPIAPQPAETVDAPAGQPAASPTPDTRPIAGLSTERSTRSSEYSRAVARLGIQAAEALDHAHQQGIVHRDVKPANLIVDAAGQLWVTDFGLAYVQSNTQLTMTGDLVGTLRYMSPEQALAKRVVVDHRTDIYSLGATLYELLTLEPVFTGGDRQELLRQIAFEEPRRPRQWNRAIPKELETIVLKAMERNPIERYGTAQELADDLRRFLEDKPIQAQRPTLRQRLGRLARRRPKTIAAAVLVVVVLLIGLWWWDRQATRAEAAARALAADADKTARAVSNEAAHLQAAGRFPEALTTAKRALDLLPRSGGDAVLRREVEERLADLQLLEHLDEARFAMCDSGGHKNFSLKPAAQVYRQAFLDYGVEVLAGHDSTLRAALERRGIRAEIAIGLDEWAACTTDAIEKQRLTELADALDPDPVHLLAQVRRAVRAQDKEELKWLGAAAGADPPSLLVLVRVMAYLNEAHIWGVAESLGRAGARRFQGDFWLNLELAKAVADQGQKNQALRYYSVAAALRPQAATPQYCLGHYLRMLGRLEEAEFAFHRAIEVRPEYVTPYFELAELLANQRRDYAEAEKVCRRCLEFQPDYIGIHLILGRALEMQQQKQDAVEIYRKALILVPGVPKDYGDLTNLGRRFWALGNYVEAEAAWRKAIELTPSAETYEQLAGVLTAQDKWLEAEAAYRKAIELLLAAPPASIDDATIHRNRYSASCCAARAGSGQGQDAAALDEKDRARLRRQSLDWLKADLAVWVRQMDEKPDQVRDNLMRTMAAWLANSDFNGVRGPEALAKLPEAERAEWQELWEQVAALRKWAQGKQK